MAEELLTCSRCGYPIMMGAILDEKMTRDREQPEYMHMGCGQTEGVVNEQAAKSSPVRGTGTIPGFMFGL